MTVLSLRPSVAGALALTLAVLLAAGCTARQSREQYEERLDQAIAVRAEVVAELDAKQLRTHAELLAASERVQESVDEITVDPPPRQLAEGHERMVEGMSGLALLLRRLSRCERLAERAPQDARACRASIDQGAYDQISNDFREADTIFRDAGVELPGSTDGSQPDEQGGDDVLG